MTRNEQVSASVEIIKDALRLLAMARQHLTLGEFEDAIKNRMTELGGAGFIASVGSAMVSAARR